MRGMLRPIGPDDLMSLRAAATIGDAAFDLALLRVGILAPAELDEIRSLVLHPTACLEPTRNSRRTPDHRRGRTWRADRQAAPRRPGVDVRRPHGQPLTRRISSKLSGGYSSVSSHW